MVILRYLFTRNGHGAAHPHNTQAECLDCAKRIMGEDIANGIFSHSFLYKVEEYESSPKGVRQTGNGVILTEADAIPFVKAKRRGPPKTTQRGKER